MDVLCYYYNKSIHKAISYCYSNMLYKEPEKLGLSHPYEYIDYYNQNIMFNCQMCSNCAEYLVSRVYNTDMPDLEYYENYYEGIEDTILGLLKNDTLIGFHFAYKNIACNHNFSVFYSNNVYYWFEASFDGMRFTIFCYYNKDEVRKMIETRLRNSCCISLNVSLGSFSEKNIKFNYQCLKADFKRFLTYADKNYVNYYNTVGKGLDKKRAFLQPAIDIVHIQ